MRPPSSISSSDPVRAWALVIGAVLLVEAWVALAAPVSPPMERSGGLRLYLSGVQPSFDASVLHWQIERLRHLDEPAEALIIGDSSALIGLDPAVLREQTGLRTEGIATIAHLGVSGQADLLQTYLDRLAPPQVVIAQFGDWSLATSDADADRMGWRAAVRAWIGLDDRPVARWPSHRLRPAARQLLGGGWHQAGARDAAVAEELRRTRGHVDDPLPLQDWSDAPRPRPAVHPDAARGLVRLVRLAQDAGAALLLVHPPVPQVFDSPATRAAYADTAARLKLLLSDLGHGALHTPFAELRPTAEFSSVDHLAADGARRHSRAVARSLVDRDAPAPQEAP